MMYEHKIKKISRAARIPGRKVRAARRTVGKVAKPYTRKAQRMRREVRTAKEREEEHYRNLKKTLGV